MSVTGMVISGSNTEFRNGNTDVLMVFGSSVVKGMLVPTVNVCVGLPAPCARALETSNNDAPNKAEPPPINCRRVSRTRPIGHSLPEVSSGILERSRIHAQCSGATDECQGMNAAKAHRRRSDVAPRRAGGTQLFPCGQLVRVSMEHGWRRSANCGQRG